MLALTIPRLQYPVTYKAVQYNKDNVKICLLIVTFDCLFCLSPPSYTFALVNFADHSYTTYVFVKVKAYYLKQFA